MRIPRNDRPLYLIGALGIMIAATLACNAPERLTPSPESIPVLPQPYTSRPSPTPPPDVATPTPFPDVSGPGGCTLNGAFIADVTIPDGTEISPGEPFTKTWRMRNSGTCDWEMETQLVFISGESMGTKAVDVEQTTPEAEIDITVYMVAPTLPGSYRSTWQLQDPKGIPFGTQVFAQIIVPEPISQTPTATVEPTEKSTQERGDLPDLTVSALALNPDPPVQGQPTRVELTIRNQGSKPASNFDVEWWSAVDLSEPSCEWTIEVELAASLTMTLGCAFTYTDSHDSIVTKAIVDAHDNLAEKDETNNSLEQETSVERP